MCISECIRRSTTQLPMMMRPKQTSLPSFHILSPKLIHGRDYLNESPRNCKRPGRLKGNSMGSRISCVSCDVLRNMPCRLLFSTCDNCVVIVIVTIIVAVLPQG